jgi:hypothetical protein
MESDRGIWENVDSDSGTGEGAVTVIGVEPDCPARTIDQSSSSHFQVAVLLTLA